MKHVRKRIGRCGADGRSLPFAIGVFLALGFCPVAAMAQETPQTTHPRDFTGIWTNANLTPVSRPRGVEKLEASPEEARRMAESAPVLGFARNEADFSDQIDPNAPAPEKGSADFGVKGYNSFWLSTGDSLALVKGTYRTSNVVDPSNGQIPYKNLAEVSRKARASGARFVTGVDPYEGPEALGIAERCLLAFSGAGGPGMFTPIYNNNYQFILTDTYLVIHVEMVHEARIIPIFPSADEARTHHRPDVIRPWLGDTVGWWQGDTLVAESINLHPIQAEQGQIPLSPKGKITERFQRWADDEIFYSFTVEDEENYARPWTVENSFRPQKSIYEYACHEGNYAMPGILIGARKRESEEAAAAAAKTKQ